MICNTPIFTLPLRIKNGEGKFCSYECYWKNKKGKPSWNKGTTGIMKAWNKGKKLPELSMEKSCAWKGGRTIHGDGYIFIYVPEHPFSNNGYVFEHRIIVEKQIGRYLKTEESVHHIDKIKNHNDPHNLMAFTSESAHQRFHKNPNNVRTEEIIFDGRKI